MEVKTLCLGVLSMGDASGYEIKKIFEQGFSHFFAAGYGSIYPALNGLAAEGLVRWTEMEQGKRPDKKVYSITEKGREAFLKALAETYPAHKVRSQFLVLTFFSGMLSTGNLERMLDLREAAITDTLATLEGHAKEMGECPAGMRFTIGYGMAVLRASLDYIRSNRGWLVNESSDVPCGVAMALPEKPHARRRKGDAS